MGLPTLIRSSLFGAADGLLLGDLGAGLRVWLTCLPNGERMVAR
jgi:hypothetical protein